MNRIPHDEMEEREKALLDRLPFEADHVPDSVTERFDAVLLESFSGAPPVTLVDSLVVERGTVLELKTCQVWVSHAGSNGGRRRGAFAIYEAAHAEMLDRGGFYSLNVLDGEDVVAGRLIPAEALDRRLTWSSYRAARERARLPWKSVFAEDQVEGATA